MTILETPTTPTGNQPVALLCTSNGVGLGHLTRQMAVGRHLRATHDVVIFTLSPAATLAVDAGFHTEYLRSHEGHRHARQNWEQGKDSFHDLNAGPAPTS